MSFGSQFRRLPQILAPWGSRRRRYYELGLKGTKILLHEGPGILWWKYKRYRSHSHIVRTTVKLASLATLALPAEDKLEVINRKVSVVIPTRNAGPDFYFTLERISGAKGIGAKEIIIIDSGSTDGTVLMAEKYGARIIHIPPAEFNHGLTRNLGASQASGDYLLFMVQDVIPIGDRWLYEMLRAIENDSTIAAVICRQVPRSDADLFACQIAWNHYRFLGLSSDSVTPANLNMHELPWYEKRRFAGLDDVCGLIKRDIFTALQFKKISYAEDLDLGLRLVEKGYKIAFLHSVGVIHSHNRPASYWFKRSYVESRQLPGILQYKPDRDMLSGKDLAYLFGGVTGLYSALNTSLASLTGYADPFERLYPELVSRLKNNLGPGPQRLTGNWDGPLNDIIKRLGEIIGETGRKPNDFLLAPYLNSVETAALYLKSYGTLQDKIPQFHDLLYKLFSTTAGGVIGAYFLEKSAQGKIDGPFKNIDTILSEGV
jgi:glycosyltransferase involved in cell wall biosynthesis